MKLTPKTKTTRRCSGQQKETLKFDLTINSWFTGDLIGCIFYFGLKAKKKGPFSFRYICLTPCSLKFLFTVRNMLWLKTKRGTIKTEKKNHACLILKSKVESKN